MTDNRKLSVRLITLTIDCPFAEAYSFASEPGNFARWASGLSTSLHRIGDVWHADTPAGAATVTFSPHNPYGVLDHWVSLAGKPDIYIPLRMIKNGDATEIMFTLFRQPGMDEAAFDEDAGHVERDLMALKALLEGGTD
jgi:hypothetical protein